MSRIFVTRSRLASGFSLVELMLTFAIVAVLAAGAFAGYGKWIQRGDAVSCRVNLKNLHAGLLNYINDKHTWPQEPGSDDDSQEMLDAEELGDWWYEALKPYGVDRNAWYCPAELRILRKMGDKNMPPDGSYVPLMLDYGDYEPYRYPNQPWAIERADFHGDGLLKVMPNGTIEREINLDALRQQNQRKNASN
jgi:prepilin-type N-terminal cleavage/methylation domain-containing protein